MAVGHWWDDTGLGERRPVDMRDHIWSTRSLWLTPVWLFLAVGVSRAGHGALAGLVAFAIPAAIWMLLLAVETRRVRAARQDADSV